MNPRHQLEHIIRTAQNLHEHWRDFATTNNDLATSQGDQLGVHGGDHCDPVYAGALGNQTYTEVTSAIAEALGSLLEAERKVTNIRRQHPETTRVVDAAKRAARCADPVCDDNAVKDGYCFRHFTHTRSAS